ncbi:ATP-binding cassette domain-containing protein [Paenibacillus albidus]|nr:ATP-binding cassette domain-containing protein [Paenibacillus albidus]
MRISVKLTLVVVTLSLMIIVISSIYTRLMKSTQQNQIIYSTKNQNLISEIINNVITIKSFSGEELMLSKWEDSFRKQMEFEKKKAKYSAFLGNIPLTIQMIFPAIIYSFGSAYIHSNILSIGSLIAFNTLASFFLTPILSLSAAYSDVIIVKIYINKLLDILNSKKEEEGEEKLHITEGKISVSNLCYKFNHFSNNVLDHINFEINGGEKVAIVGKSGSGKSTLLKALCSIYVPDSGNIKIDDVDLGRISKSYYRGQIGVVLQESELFNASIKDNILFSRDISDAELVEIIQKSNIQDIIANSPIGIETMISESGVNISGGQRQRLTLARALVTKPKLLFMDEPTSSLDNSAEQAFINNIFSLVCTCIIISHRFYNIEQFDKIIVLDKGKVVGIGKHDYLMNTCAEYQLLYPQVKTYSVS